MTETSATRIHWNAVIIGYLSDTMLSAIFQLSLTPYIPELASGQFFASSRAWLAGVVLALFTITSGWLAAAIANEERFLHGVMVGGASLMLLLLAGLGGEMLTLDQIVLQCVATVLAGLAGVGSTWVRLPWRRRQP